MHSLHSMHKMHVYRADHVCPFSCPHICTLSHTRGIMVGKSFLQCVLFLSDVVVRISEILMLVTSSACL
jgi:hypothetical protein